VKAQFIYFANPDPPFNNGAGLYFTALENNDGSSYLSDGTLTFGDFGGNARTTLFDQIVRGWTIIDGSTVESGNVITSTAEVTGGADLSAGLVINTGQNDTLNFDLNGTPNTIILRPGSYDTAGLINEINDQFTNNSIPLQADLNIFNNLVISQTSPFDGDII